MDKSELNIIRKLCWIYHKSTGIEWDELFGEATLAYLESLQTFNSKKRSSKNTWIYICVRNSLIDFIRKENKNKFMRIDDCNEEDWKPLFHPFFLSFEFIDSLSKDSQLIVSAVMEKPTYFATVPPKMARGRLTKTLREKGWGYQRIWDGMRRIKQELNQTTLS